jgi:signal transduction histidine kinase
LVQNLWITDVDESLVYQKDKMVEAITSNNLDSASVTHYTEMASKFDLGIYITSLQGVQHPKDSVYDNQLNDLTRQHIEPYRELCSVVKVNNKYYKIIVRKDLVENADLIQAIGVTQAILLFILLIGIVILNSYFSKKAWKPFYLLISKLKTYKIDSEKQIEIQPSEIDEFNELNLSVQRLTENNIQIYRAQKEFTENAAHETQTPLAAIKNQVDLLAQDANLNEAQSEIINRIDKNIRLLTKLNRNLLFLSKIENDQFNKLETVDVYSVVSEIVEAFEEQIKLKGISLTFSEKEKPVLSTNNQLLISLITNLLTNAIKYNIPAGKIEIKLTKQSFQIINSGVNQSLPEDKIYERFYKNSQLSESSGLGLAIAKKICNSLGYEMQYKFSEPDFHSFTIKFA